MLDYQTFLPAAQVGCENTISKDIRRNYLKVKLKHVCQNIFWPLFSLTRKDLSVLFLFLLLLSLFLSGKLLRAVQLLFLLALVLHPEKTLWNMKACRIFSPA